MQKIALAKSTTNGPFETVFVDNVDATDTGLWVSSTGTSDPFYGGDYYHDGDMNKGLNTVTYQPTLAGSTYDVFARWTSHPNRATNVPFTINSENSTDNLTVNQENDGGTWNLLGSYTFAPGSGGSVVIGTANTNGYVVADALRFAQTGAYIPSNPPPDVILDNTDATGVSVVGGWVSSTGTSDPFYGSDYFHDGNTSKGDLPTAPA